MKRFLMWASVLVLLAAPAMADSSVSTTTETTRTAVVPVPVPPPAESTTTYGSSTVTHKDDGIKRTDTRSDTYIAPDGSTSSKTKVIEQEKH
jgi:opacity protein-like surface antigen